MAEPITLTYRPDLQALIVRWFQPVDDVQMRRDYEAIAAEAVAHEHCRRWLFDIRRRHLGGDDLNAWAGREFFPRLPEALGAPVQLAFLATPMQLAQVVLGSAGKVVEDAGQVGSRIHFFADEGPALDWLTR